MLLSLVSQLKKLPARHSRCNVLECKPTPRYRLLTPSHTCCAVLEQCGAPALSITPTKPVLLPMPPRWQCLGSPLAL